MSISKKRNIGLDFMRSFAIVIVLLQHSLFILPVNDTTKVVSQIFNLIDGVSIFFVLSGFLIGNILINEVLVKKMNFKSLVTFWKRRWLRTIPSYYLILTFVLIMSLFETRLDGYIYFSYYIFLQNVFFEIATFFPEAWSLSIEEWFYFMFPITLLFFLKLIKNHQAILFSILTFIVVALVFRLFAIENNASVDLRKSLVFRLDAIAFGVMFSYLNFKQERIFQAKKNQFFVLGIVLIFSISLIKQFFGTYFLVLFYSLESLSYALMLPFIFYLDLKEYQNLKSIFYYFSTRAYLLYLCNLSLVIGIFIPIFKKNVAFVNEHFSIYYSLFWLLNVIIVEVIYRCFERPILVWRDKTILL